MMYTEIKREREREGGGGGLRLLFSVLCVRVHVSIVPLNQTQHLLTAAPELILMPSNNLTLSPSRNWSFFLTQHACTFDRSNCTTNRHCAYVSVAYNAGRQH